jgi:replicative DNA helicase
MSNSDISKVPPQAIELEEAILGSFMIDKNAVSQYIDTVKEEYFYKDAHKCIFKAIQSLNKKGDAIDLLTITEELKSTDELDVVGGIYTLAQLSGKVSSTENLEYHIKIITQKYLRRALIQSSDTAVKQAYDESEDIFDTIRAASSSIDDMTGVLVRRDVSTSAEVVTATLQELQRKQKEGFSGLPSGFTQFDSLYGGFHNTDLVILAARPGMGKTSFALSIMYNMAVNNNIPVGIFSLEMSEEQLITRLLSYETQIPTESFRKLNLSDNDWAVLSSNAGRVADAPIYICDTPALSIFDIRAKARQLKEKHDIKFLIIDYLQLANSDGSSRKARSENDEVTKISQTLKAIAKELNIPVLALSQLNRDVEKRSDKKPMLADLRASGSIEQDADSVLFLYRPDYYEDNDEISESGYTELLIRKNRHGACGKSEITFKHELTQFVSPADDYSFVASGIEENPNYYESQTPF